MLRACLRQSEGNPVDVFPGWANLRLIAVDRLPVQPLRCLGRIVRQPAYRAADRKQKRMHVSSETLIAEIVRVAACSNPFSSTFTGVDRSMLRGWL